MKLIKIVLLAVLAVIALVIGILFSSRNNTPVALDILVYQLPPMSIALWILVSFTFGALLSGLIYSLINQTHKRRYNRLLRQINHLKAVQGAVKQP
ncbi:MAG: LapA family protein [Gammaproteobacteria bacterium]|nr:LapA family protein [Gammaproteobacteria bacterium]